MRSHFIRQHVLLPRPNFNDISLRHDEENIPLKKLTLQLVRAGPEGTCEPFSSIIRPIQSLCGYSAKLDVITLTLVRLSSLATWVLVCVGLSRTGMLLTTHKPWHVMRYW